MTIRTPRRPSRGVTLFEVLIVVAILALIASAVGIAAFDAWKRAQIEHATSNAREMRHAVKTFWVQRDATVCPDVERLLSDGLLERGSPKRDPWGGAWVIECDGEDATVVSAGPDRQRGTSDDIRAPPLDG